MIDIENRIRRNVAQIAGARITVGGTDSGSKMELMLLGEEAHVLAQTGREAERQLRSIPGIGSVTSSAALVQPELIIPSRLRPGGRTGHYGGGHCAHGARGHHRGLRPAMLPKLNLPERQVPIRVKLPESYRDNIDNIRQLLVPGRGGAVMVPLQTVASVAFESGPSLIERSNRSRSIKLTVELGGRALGDVDAAARALPVSGKLPPGITLSQQAKRRSDGQTLCQFRRSHGDWRVLRVCGAGAAVQGFHAAHHHPGRPAAVD